MTPNYYPPTIPTVKCGLPVGLVSDLLLACFFSSSRTLSHCAIIFEGQTQQTQETHRLFFVRRTSSLFGLPACWVSCHHLYHTNPTFPPAVQISHLYRSNPPPSSLQCGLRRACRPVMTNFWMFYVTSRQRSSPMPRNIGHSWWY